jgi:UPF0271 protein
MMAVDLNADVGEGFGAYAFGCDEAILACITSANIACGFHAGDPATMRRTVRLALANGVAIGAHPGLPDLAGFGRRELAISREEAYDLIVYQVGALRAFATAAGAVLRHVKPHGALYNMAARQADLAMAVVTAVRDVDPTLTLFGLAGSELIRAGHSIGLATANEVFADRRYESDGTLTPRTECGAVITDPAESTEQVIRMVREGRVRSRNGVDVAIQADTICLHGDGPHAVELAQRLRAALTTEGITIRATDAAGHSTSRKP